MYEGFAPLYDALMADTPYDAWAAFIDGVLGGGKMVLDLACGTGAISLRLAKMGYDVIGADVSADMLAVAQQNAHEVGCEILFIRQDMRRLELFGTVDAVVCVCDGLNYMLTEDDLRTVFSRVRLFLNPGGVFIFDMNTEYKFKEMFGEKVLAGAGGGGEAYEWQNAYDPESGINEYNLTLHAPGCAPFDELHRQRAYPPADVCNLLLATGFSSVAMRDCYSAAPPTAESWKITYIARV